MPLRKFEMTPDLVERIAFTGDLNEIEPDGLVTVGFEFTPPRIGRTAEEWAEVVKERFPTAVIRGTRETTPSKKYDHRGNLAKGVCEVFFVIADD